MLIFRVVVLILIIVPIAEIWGLLKVGQWIGAWPAVLIVVATAIIGGYVAKREGLQVLRLVQLQLQRGELPREAILDGICILAGGLLLLTPGFFTDLAGIVLVVPLTRGIVKIALKKWFWNLIQDGKIITIRRR